MEYLFYRSHSTLTGDTFSDQPTLQCVCVCISIEWASKRQQFPTTRHRYTDTRVDTIHHHPDAGRNEDFINKKTKKSTNFPVCARSPVYRRAHTEHTKLIYSYAFSLIAGNTPSASTCYIFCYAQSQWPVRGSRACLLCPMWAARQCPVCSHIEINQLEYILHYDLIRGRRNEAWLRLRAANNFTYIVLPKRELITPFSVCYGCCHATLIRTPLITCTFCFLFCLFFFFSKLTKSVWAQLLWSPEPSSCSTKWEKRKRNICDSQSAHSFLTDQKQLLCARKNNLFRESAEFKMKKNEQQQRRRWRWPEHHLHMRQWKPQYNRKRNNI